MIAQGLKNYLFLFFCVGFIGFSACEFQGQSQDLGTKVQVYKAEVKLSNLHYRASSNNEEERLLEKYDKAFNQGNYLAAITGYQYVIEGNGPKSSLLIRLGIAHWKAGNLQKAKYYFTRIYMPRDNMFYLEAAWYLGLLALEEKKQSEAKEFLQEIASSRNRHSNHAKELLDLL